MLSMSNNSSNVFIFDSNVGIGINIQSIICKIVC
jgi:hypothetical protein